MTKGEDTRSAILRQALHLASEVGLEGLSVGALAKKVGMSKSGLYAHFESKEDLQSQVLDAAAERFIDVVVAPALKKSRGLPRVKSLFELWIDSTHHLSGGCPFVAASTEFDDRPGLVRDRLVGHLRDVIGTIIRAARISVEEGHFRKDLDTEQFAFEMWAILLAYHLYSRLTLRGNAQATASHAFAKLIETAGAGG